MRYKHPYTAAGFAVDMKASREDIISRFNRDPAQYWAPHCKVLDLVQNRQEVLVYSTDNKEQYTVTCVLHDMPL
jgi:hypothetical protein